MRTRGGWGCWNCWKPGHHQHGFQHQPLWEDSWPDHRFSTLQLRCHIRKHTAGGKTTPSVTLKPTLPLEPESPTCRHTPQPWPSPSALLPSAAPRRGPTMPAPRWVPGAVSAPRSAPGSGVGSSGWRGPLPGREASQLLRLCPAIAPCRQEPTAASQQSQDQQSHGKQGSAQAQGAPSLEGRQDASPCSGHPPLKRSGSFAWCLPVTVQRQRSPGLGGVAQRQAHPRSRPRPWPRSSPRWWLPRHHTEHRPEQPQREEHGEAVPGCALRAAGGMGRGTPGRGALPPVAPRRWSCLQTRPSSCRGDLRLALAP